MNEDILKKLIKLRDKFNDAGRSPGFNETLFNLMNILIEQGTSAPDDGSKQVGVIFIANEYCSDYTFRGESSEKGSFVQEDIHLRKGDKLVIIRSDDNYV